jgi:hypothetical protein
MKAEGGGMKAEGGIIVYTALHEEAMSDELSAFSFEL